MSFLDGFMESMCAQLNCLDKIGHLKTINPTAKDTGADHCVQCGVCCWRRPCGLVEEDLPLIAAKLNMPVYELFKKMLVVDNVNGLYCVLPRRKSQKDIAGKYVPDDRTYDIDTPCVFFDEDSHNCKIHDVKPRGGREFKCWDVGEYRRTGVAWSAKEDIMEVTGWDGDTYDYDGDDDE